jgi:hypothetical protein
VANVTDYRAALRQMPDWDAFLLRESRLPGPRANLELVQVVADEGDASQFRRWLAIGVDQAPANSQAEFLPLCGAVGLGRLAAEGDHEVLNELRGRARDVRWRVREGVAMGLQRLGAVDMPALLSAMAEWAEGDWLERRAAIAAVCEPVLLKEPEHARSALEMLDRLMRLVEEAPDRREYAFQAFRMALGYGWSVAIAALPDEGMRMFRAWMESGDPDVAWVVRENLKKARLKRVLSDTPRG